VSIVTDLLTKELLVTERADTCPVPRKAGPWDQVMARTRSFTLDQELAGGASPEASVRMALRARHLTGMRERRQLARGIRHLLDKTMRPAGAPRPLVPVCRDRVQAAAREFEALADRLMSPAPVPARGVAQVSVLLHDGCSPLYLRRNADDLAARVHQVVETLDVLPSW
jgi:hypothetical protein